MGPCDILVRVSLLGAELRRHGLVDPVLVHAVRRDAGAETAAVHCRLSGLARSYRADRLCSSSSEARNRTAACAMVPGERSDGAGRYVPRTAPARDS